ncbi:hypothetical protein [Halorhabdus amylolytica]|uniref:hypothetical protein n=1 Tax=Halorhabdus amylolytica TaxID=2559573 RepID=UPI0031F4AA7D
MYWIAVGLVCLFFWALIGKYVYREAEREDRPSPKLRAVFWGILGIAGAIIYVAHIREREKKRLAWLGFAIILFTLWAIGTVGLWGLSSGFYLWADLFVGMFVLYWQFNLETVKPDEQAIKSS